MSVVFGYYSEPASYSPLGKRFFFEGGGGVVWAAVARFFGVFVDVVNVVYVLLLLSCSSALVCRIRPTSHVLRIRPTSIRCCRI